MAVSETYPFLSLFEKTAGKLKRRLIKELLLSILSILLFQLFKTISGDPIKIMESTM